jgi:VWFA-related protein
MARIKTLFTFLLLPTALVSQNPPQSPPIRVSTHLVQIGIIVRDGAGPVGDLTKDDFTVFDRGKPQTISVFTETAATATLVSAQPPPPNTFSDIPGVDGASVRSITIVLLDNVNTLSGNGHEGYTSGPWWTEDLALSNAKSHLIEFIKTLDPRDRVAVYGLGETLHVLSDFSSDRDRLLAILKNYDTASRTNRDAVEPGALHTPVPGEFNARADAQNLELAATLNERRAALTTAALQSIASHVANIPGRKNLVWLTANLPFSGAALARILGPAQITAYPVDGRSLLSRNVPETEDGISERLAGVLGMGMPAQSSEPIGMGAMQSLADETGGRAFVNTNDLTGAIRTAVEDSAATYTLGFYVEPNSLDGKFHEVKVQVHRAGLTLRYPKGYFALKDAPATQDERRSNFLTAIRSPLDSSAIPMQVKFDRLNQSAPNSLGLMGSIGLRDVQLVQNGEMREGALDIYVLEQDETGKVLRQSANRIHLRFTAEKYAAILQTGVTFRETIHPQPGTTTLRILVQDPASADLGSVIIPLSEIK